MIITKCIIITLIKIKLPIILLNSLRLLTYLFNNPNGKLNYIFP